MQRKQSLELNLIQAQYSIISTLRRANTILSCMQNLSGGISRITSNYNILSRNSQKRKEKSNMAPTKNEVTKHEQIQEIVLNRINQLQQERGLALPAHYHPTNPLISARLILNQTLDKFKKPVLETCTPV